MLPSDDNIVSVCDQSLQLSRCSFDVFLSVIFFFQKCAEYWPEDTVTHEGIEITVVTVTQEDDYSLRVFALKVRHAMVNALQKRKYLKCN